MARTRKGSPRIELQITDADRATAVQSNSGGCLIADALKRAGYSNPSVDMATIRVTDREAGKRYTYLTPPNAQHCLLGFDQGWPVDGLVGISLTRAVKITPVTSSNGEAEDRASKIASLEAKTRNGIPLSRIEAAALGKMRKARRRKRPTSTGPSTVDAHGTVIGGAPIPQGPSHPNLLRGRNRVYGAKLADPGQAFRSAVEAGIRQREASGQ